MEEKAVIQSEGRLIVVRLNTEAKLSTETAHDKNQQNSMYAQRKLRSTWASAQSDQSSLQAWRKFGSLATSWAHSEDSDQTGRTCHFVGCSTTVGLITMNEVCRSISML